jgi:two-component system, LytTR family, sensor kinase
MTGSLNRWTRTWGFYHILFWAFITITFLWDIIEYAPYDLTGYLSSVFIKVFLLICLTYNNLFFLIPKIYPRSKLLYWALLVISIALFVILYKSVYFMTTDKVGELYDQAPIDVYIGRSFMAIRYLLISLFFKFLQGWFEQEKKISQIKVDQLSTELKYLRAQINPHFLFNTLNNLYGLALKKSDKTPEIIMRLSEIMDYMLYESIESKVPLKKDVDNLVNYVEIEKIRQGNNAKINFTISGEINTQKIIPLLLLPLMENGFTHGVNREPANAYLEANLEITQTAIELTVSNNRSDLPITNDKGHGIGLQNLKKRLSLFYPKKHELTIIEKADNFTAFLKIELT